METENRVSSLIDSMLAAAVLCIAFHCVALRPSRDAYKSRRPYFYQNASQGAEVRHVAIRYSLA